MDDNYSLWARHDEDQESMLYKLPECSCCGQKIQDEFCYEINGELLCIHCLNEYFRKDVEDYIA